MIGCPYRFSCRFRSIPRTSSHLAMSQYHSRSTVLSTNHPRKQLHSHEYIVLCHGLHLPSTPLHIHRHLETPSYRSQTSHRSPTDLRSEIRQATRGSPIPVVSFPRYPQCTLCHLNSLWYDFLITRSRGCGQGDYHGIQL